MRCIQQIKLLAWKNYTSHRRQKLRCLVEIVWPLLLMAILMWVRTRGLRVFVHECHFDHKAMPSAGILPFIKSTFCSLNNTCNPTITDGHSSVISDLRKPTPIKTLETVLRTHLTEDALKSFTIIDADLDTFSELIKRVTDPESKFRSSVRLKDFLTMNSFRNLPLNLSESEASFLDDMRLNWTILPHFFRDESFNILRIFCDDLNSVSGLFIQEKEDFRARDSLYQRFCDTSERGNLSESVQIFRFINYGRLLEEISLLANESVGRPLHTGEVRASFNAISNILNDISNNRDFSYISNDIDSYWSTLRELIDNPVNNSVKFVQKWICGRNTSKVYERFAGGPGSKLEDLSEEMKEHFIHNRPSNNTEYIYDNSTSPECNKLFQQLESGSLTKVLWKQLKPFVRGKILFSPNVTPIEQVLDRVKSYFEPVKVLQNLTRIWLEETSPKIKENFLKGSPLLSNLTTQTIKNNLQLIVDGVARSSNMDSKDSRENLSIAIKQINEILDYISSNSTEILERLNKFVSMINTYLDCAELNKTEGLATEEELVKRGLSLILENRLWAGIVFENLNTSNQSSIEQLPPYVRYKIRMDASKVDSTKKIEDRIATPGSRRRPALDLKYLTFGFAYLQDMIEKAIIREHTNSTSDTGIYLQQFPYPCHLYDQFIMAISRSFPMFMVLSWVYNASMIIKSIVHEKEKRLKEVMKVMGLSSGVLWFSWFLESLLFLSISSFLLTLILHFGKILTYSDPFIIFIFLLCYSISVITQSFAISTLFGKANMAAAGGGMLFFMTYLPYTFLILWEDILFVHEKMLACLFPNVAFGFGCSYLAHFEEEGIGIQWDNIYSSPIPNDEFSMTHILFLLLIDSVIYMIAAWYIEAVWPGQYGVPKPFYFFLTYEYWRNDYKKVKYCDDVENKTTSDDAANFEKEPTDLPLGISIRNLTKIYPGKKLALNQLSLNFYEGQITSFLGHNGAGKTTTISILTGVFPPTSGTAKIYGYDIIKEMDVIRKSLGNCPQYNVLFGHLTVHEHLRFYASLKGCKESDIESEIDQLIKDLGLQHKRDEFPGKLSGGMQRKLSIAMAFVGGSRTVILDEPTAGVDPYSRRSIWELLIKYKKNRTVILTTHHMDEADLLGDRIAVIAEGKLRCVGSSLFLKSRFGNGYYLTCVMKKSHLGNGFSVRDSSPNLNHTPNNISPNLSNHISATVESNGTTPPTRTTGLYTPKLMEFIQRYVPEARMIEKVGGEATFLLPSSAQDSGALQKFLEDFDDHLSNLEIQSYGISDTPLEEVFLRVTGTFEEPTSKSSEEVLQNVDKAGSIPLRRTTEIGRRLANVFNRAKFLTMNRNSSHQNGECFEMNTSNTQEDEAKVPLRGASSNLQCPLINKRLEGWSLTRAQCFALQAKRFHHTRRNSRALLCEIVLPAMLICVAMLFTLIIPPIMEEPQLELKPWLYGPPNYAFFSDDSLGHRPVDKYIDGILGETGIGAKCVKGIPEKYRQLKPKLYAFSSVKRDQWMDRCNASEVNKDLTSPYNLSIVNKVVECDCSLGTMQCPEFSPGFEPPSTPIVTEDIMYNLTGRNISDWIVKTGKRYYKKRYGGFTFAFNDPLASFNKTSAESLFSYFLTLFKVTDNRADLIENFDKLLQYMEKSDLWNNVKVWFNNKGWAASVSYMNAVNNILLRENLPQGADKKFYGITAINHPMNFTEDQLKDELFKRGGISLLHAITVLFAMSFVPASFVLYLIEERVSGSKHLQFVSGVNPNVYWTSAYLWDFANYLVPSFLCVMIFITFNAEAYISKDNIIPFITLLILYGFASIPLMYPTSHLFTLPSSAFVALASVNLFIGTVTTVSTFVLELFDDDELQFIGNLLKKIFLIFPQYCLGRGLLEMSAQHMAARIFARYGFQMKRDPFEWTFLGRNMFALLIEGIIFFRIVLWMESGILWRFREPKGLSLEEEEDSDVAMEREKIINGNASDAVLRVENLTKVFREGQLPAVNKLWLSVKPGECFGLLGVNGAGKTTTFKMLTGNIKIGDGEAYIANYRVKTEMNLARSHIGYCPQFDALDNFLTGREHLEVYARLRGIPEDKIGKVVKWSIRKLGLSKYKNICAGTYSGGNRRKLSTAIALVGQPSVVFLDEPTTGMDPKARRFLWNCILDIIKDRCAVVLTSHSMEECEALCSRLAIMVNGKFKCLGSTQHLKSKFGEGYTVSLKVSGDKVAMDSVQSEIVSIFGGSASLKETHLNQIEYQIGAGFPISKIFKELENMKKSGRLEDYSVTQTTLDQVFIRFARTQMDLYEKS